MLQPLDEYSTSKKVEVRKKKEIKRNRRRESEMMSFDDKEKKSEMHEDRVTIAAWT